ncbi:MAG: QacE family quaternary ammonium compound efflux SMR transporter [Sphingomonas taxi]|uniref:QacE family quaternary ammonium compound efflux SMR transporter n=1 Tax=Sphingomonas taxi TaxID=1549858 RepID=A0A2W5AEW6_9SPHN|nr:MAG: QacE family quaternary ammonium compound efflux SMR transporter [Sphingomonas taxi]
MTWVLLVVAVLCEVGAALSLRTSDGLRDKRWIPVLVVLYGAAFGLLAVILSLGAPLGIVYGLWAAGGVALTAIASKVFFGEALTLRMLAGIVTIAAGVLLIEAGAH